VVQFWGGVLLGVVLGGLVSWAITHRYYIRSGRDQKAIYEKLSADMRSLILADKRASLSVEDLNALLRERVLDDSSTETLRYKACPKCGSENVYPNRDYLVDVEAGDDGMPVHTATPYKTVECMDCGWRDDEIRSDIERIRE